jgi:hypothetical protein
MRLDELTVKPFEVKKSSAVIGEFLREPANRLAVDVIMAIRDGYQSRDELIVELELKEQEIIYAFTLIGSTMLEKDTQKITPMLRGPRFKLSEDCERAVFAFLEEHPHERRFRKQCTQEEVRLFCERHLESIALYTDIIKQDMTADLLSILIPLGMNRACKFRVKTWFSAIAESSRFDGFSHQIEKLKQIRLIIEDQDAKLGINIAMRPVLPLTWQRLQPASQERLARFKRRIEAMFIP